MIELIEDKDDMNKVILRSVNLSFIYTARVGSTLLDSVWPLGLLFQDYAV